MGRVATSRKWWGQNTISSLSEQRDTCRGERGKGNGFSLADLVGAHLPVVMVGGTRWAVEVIRVQTGPPHIGLSHLCLV